VFPVWLGVDYGRTPAYIETHDWAYYTWLVPAAVLALLVNYRAPRPLLAGVLVFVIALLPVLGFVDFHFQAFSTVADRYLYVSMLGVALCAAWALSRPWCREPARRRRVALAGAGLLLTLGVLAYVQAGYWRDTETLTRNTGRVRGVGPKRMPASHTHVSGTRHDAPGSPAAARPAARRLPPPGDIR
jgi:protein O-mannosyl-transferase